MSSLGLCSRCETLDFEALLRGPWSHLPTKIRDLGDIWAENQCSFCKLIRRTFSEFYGADAVEACIELGHALETQQMVWVGRNPLNINQDIFEASGERLACYLYFFLDHENDKLDMGVRLNAVLVRNKSRQQRNDVPSIISLRDDSREESGTVAHMGRAIGLNHVNWEFVKSWLAICLDRHGGRQKTKPTATIWQLRVIDVMSDCVVILPPGAEYIALSYMWGRDQRIKLKRGNKAHLERPGCFTANDGQPSRTIVDAIQVTRRLGYRYIWVDALCIVQDDMANVVAETSRMNDVYGSAALTIVAAAGTDAEHGLSGVSVPRSRPQRRARIGGITVANRLQALSVVESSRWNTRAWTYQERVLSRRRLVFTDAQLYFECDDWCCFEEQFHMPPSPDEAFTSANLHASLNFEMQNIWDVYATAVGAYTGRNLTSSGDKIRAFSGITKRLEHPFRAPFLFGLPANSFAIALLWTPLNGGPCRRTNMAFPSWSWAGWTGQVGYDYSNRDTLYNFCASTVTQCHIRFENSVLATKDEDNPSGNRKCWTRHFDKDEQQISYSISSPTDLQPYLYPTPLDPWPYGDLSSSGNPMHLTIEGRVACLGLIGSQPYSGRLGHSLRTSHESHCLAIVDSQGHVAGFIVVDSGILPHLLRPGNKPTQHKFLAISRSTLERTSTDPAWDKKHKCFRHWKEDGNLDYGIGLAADDDEDDEEDDDSDDSGDDDDRDDSGLYEEYKLDPIPGYTAEPSSATPQSTGAPRPLDRSTVFEKGNTLKLNDHEFDSRYYSEHKLWPLLNVLLISKHSPAVTSDHGTSAHDSDDATTGVSQQSDGHGEGGNQKQVYERVGIGQIHIDAFDPMARTESLLLA